MQKAACPFCRSAATSVYKSGEKDAFRELNYPYTFFFCRTCRARFQVSSADEARKLYADIQEAAVRNVQSKRKEIRYEDDIIRTFSRLGHGKAILDIGTGDGWLMKQAREAGLDCMGIDVSEKFAELASARSGVDIRVGTLHEMKFEDGQFDFINLDMVLMYVPDPIQLFEEIHRVLKPGGLLRVHEYDPDGLFALMEGRSYWMYAPTHLAAIPRKSLKMLGRLTHLRLYKTVAGTEASLSNWLATRRQPDTVSSIKDTLTFFLRKLRLGNFTLASDTTYFFTRA